MSKTPYNKEFPDKKLTPFGLEGSYGVKLIIFLQALTIFQFISQNLIVIV